jgi:CubicO group peptidase (beta-lactamase class C family)
VIAALEHIIDKEMRRWGIGGVALALVDDQRIVCASGFGQARRDSIFRVGSVSKLLNAIGVMQQVEAGRLSLDAALSADVLPLNPFADNPPVTLRQTLCHRSGLQREATVGGYFDASEPGLAATIASARSCVLATRPGEAMRYSNFAPSVAGLMVERSSGLSFEDYQRRRLLDPLGMTDSAWSRAHVSRERLLPSRMRVADGNGGWTNRTAPLFDLGTIPAGNLFSTVDDLARFASALMAGGGGLVKPETLREMWRIQFTSTEPPAFGLGFIVGQFRQHRMISHNGAVYGHSSFLGLLPEAKVAVVVLANEDIVNGRTRRIANAALSHLLEAKFGEPPPPQQDFSAPPKIEDFAGDYESQSFWASLETRDGQLTGNISGQPAEFRPAGGLNFALNSRLDDATPVAFEEDATGTICGFRLGTQHFRRVVTPAPSLPREWLAFCGCYGPDFIPLIVSERHGHLYAMSENMVDYHLTPVNRNTCALPPGMYWGEQAVFLTGPGGTPHAVNFANMLLARDSRAGSQANLYQP